MNTAEISRKAKNIIFNSSRFAKDFFAGYYRSAFKGPGMEFAEVREYTRGDDVRSIDWNVSARMGSVYTKRFHEERELPVFIVLDVSGSMRYGSAGVTKQETAAVCAAIFAYAAAYNNDRVGAVLFSGQIDKWIPMVKGSRHAAGLVREMLSVEPGAEGSDLNRALRGVYESVNRRGICMIISDFKVAVDAKLLALVKKKQDLIAVRVTDPAEMNFPSVGGVEIRDIESGQSFFAAGGGRRGFRRQYQAKMEQMIGETADLCKALKIDILDISTEDDPFQAVKSFFKKRK